MNAFVFPGQGSQFQGMGKALAEQHKEAAALFAQANEILGFSLTEIMFEGSAKDLRETRVTQPAIFVHSMAVRMSLGDGFTPQMVAGHSLGEFSALTATGALSFADGLQLVAQRAQAMQDACNQSKGTMAAVLALDDSVVEEVCEPSPAPCIVYCRLSCTSLATFSLSVLGDDRPRDVFPPGIPRS
ncbi:MAG: ACP S-malonyltransferase, partial [Bacteroidota bacterium]|nr:ACP S-malonyltransferase [Bacteroidota bacterium]